MTQASGIRIGRYELLEKLGEGGMAEVWKARNLSIGLVVAIKVLLKSFAHDNDLQQRFLNEGRIQARLRHPNIVSVFDAYSEDGTSYLVMDFVDGETLEARLRDNARRPLTVPEVLSISSDILAALEYAHTLPDGPIVHRDVKPSNILLDKEGRARLADFGIAVALNEDRKTKVGLAPGSIHYMSPEQIQTPRSIDRRSDIYSFGCVLYEMLTGNPPFVSDTDSDFKVHQAHVYQQPEPLRKRNPQVPFEFEWIVLKALNKDRELRFSSAKEMAKVLKDAAAEGALEVSVKQPEPLSKVAPEKRRATVAEEIAAPVRGKFPWKPALAGVALLVVAVALLRAFWLHSSTGTYTPISHTPAANLAPEIDSVRFFPYEYGRQYIPNQGERSYQDSPARFRKNQVAGIGWEITLKSPLSQDEEVEANWYLEGASRTVCASKDQISAGSSSASRGCSDKPGSWEAGSYRLDFVVDGKSIGSGEFRIDEAPVAGANNSETDGSDNSPPAASESLDDYLIGSWRREAAPLVDDTEFRGDHTFDEVATSTATAQRVTIDGEWKVNGDSSYWYRSTRCDPQCPDYQWHTMNITKIDHGHFRDGEGVLATRTISY